jgi:hypothetical protein
MAAVSETMVREYFELHGFFVRQQRKTQFRSIKREDEEIDFAVINPHYRANGGELPFVLTSEHMKAISRAVVVIKAWHTDTFSPSLLANTPEIFRFLEPAFFQHAAKAFGSEGKTTTILVVPALPTADEARTQSIEMLKAKGIDAVIPFWNIIADLVETTKTNRDYQKSDLLQVIRILKNYDFIKAPQMELFKLQPIRRKVRLKKQAAAEKSPAPES